MKHNGFQSVSQPTVVQLAQILLIILFCVLFLLIWAILIPLCGYVPFLRIEGLVTTHGYACLMLDIAAQ